MRSPLEPDNDCVSLQAEQEYTWNDIGCNSLVLYPLCNKIPDNNQIELFQCLKEDHSISAWYDGDSFNEDQNIWMDKSGNNNNGYIMNKGNLNIYTKY